MFLKHSDVGNVTLCSLNFAKRGKKILVYRLIIGIQEYITLFTQSLLAAACACRQNDLEGKLFFFSSFSMCDKKCHVGEISVQFLCCRTKLV